MQNNNAGKICSAVTLRPLSQRFMARCWTAGQRACSRQEQTEYKELQQVGRLVRIWRVQTGLSRTALAEKVNIDVDLLLFLEMGDALPEDLTPSQFFDLTAMLEQNGRYGDRSPNDFQMRGNIF